MSIPALVKQPASLAAWLSFSWAWLVAFETVGATVPADAAAPVALLSSFFVWLMTC